MREREDIAAAAAMTAEDGVPELKTRRQRAFVQFVRQGFAPETAYRLAGYQGRRPRAAAARMMAHPAVAPRLESPLQADIAPFATPHPEAARRIDESWIIACLVENIERSLGLKTARDGRGNPLGERVYHGSVANKALELLGRTQGMFGAATETKAGQMHELSDEELERRYRSLRQQIERLEARLRHAAGGEAAAAGAERTEPLPPLS